MDRTTGIDVGGRNVYATESILAQEVDRVTWNLALGGTDVSIVIRFADDAEVNDADPPPGVHWHFNPPDPVFEIVLYGWSPLISGILSGTINQPIALTDVNGIRYFIDIGIQPMGRTSFLITLQIYSRALSLRS